MHSPRRRLVPSSPLLTVTGMHGVTATQAIRSSDGRFHQRHDGAMTATKHGRSVGVLRACASASASWPADQEISERTGTGWPVDRGPPSTSDRAAVVRWRWRCPAPARWGIDRSIALPLLCAAVGCVTSSWPVGRAPVLAHPASKCKPRVK